MAKKRKQCLPVSREETPEETKEYAEQRKLYHKWTDATVKADCATTPAERTRYLKEAEKYKSQLETREKNWYAKHPEYLEEWQSLFRT